MVKQYWITTDWQNILYEIREVYLHNTDSFMQYSVEKVCELLKQEIYIYDGLINVNNNEEKKLLLNTINKANKLSKLKTLTEYVDNEK